MDMATFLAYLLLKLPAKRDDEGNKIQAERWAFMVALITFLPAVFLGINLYQRSSFNNNAKLYKEYECLRESNYLFSQEMAFKSNTIKLVLGGGNIANSAKNHILLSKGNCRLSDSNMQIIESLTKPMADINQRLANVNNAINEKGVKLKYTEAKLFQIQKQLTIKELEKTLVAQNQFLNQVKIIEKRNLRVDVLLTLNLKKRKPKQK